MSKLSRWGVWGGLILGWLLTGIGLMKAPFYLDEGIYIFWAKLIGSSPGYAYVSLQDGKTPLYFWLVSGINKYFNNLLFSGRLVSLVCGGLTIMAWVLIVRVAKGSKLQQRLIGVLMVTAPLLVMINRLALADSLLVAAMSISILGLVILKKYLEGKSIWILGAIVAGLFLGVTFMVKTTGKLILVGELMVIGTWICQAGRKGEIKKIMKLIIAGFIIVGLYYEMAGLIRFGGQRFWAEVAIKEKILTLTRGEIWRNVSGDWGFYADNGKLLLDYILKYFLVTVPFFGLGAIRILKKQRENLWLVVYFLVLAGGVFLSAKVITSRYLVVAVPGFLTIAAMGMEEVWRKRKIMVILSVVFNIVLSGLMMSTQRAWLARDDYSNLVTGAGTGYKLEEVEKFMKGRSKMKSLGAVGTWGMPEGVEVVLGEKGITVVKKEIGDKWPEGVDYLYVLNESEKLRDLLNSGKGKLIQKWQRPGKGESVFLVRSG